jgi:antitoxin component of MazEF toxin-antitoxin module
MPENVEIMKVTRTPDGYAMRLPKKFAEKLGITGGYVNVYLFDDKLVIEKTFKEGSQMVKP